MIHIVEFSWPSQSNYIRNWNRLYLYFVVCSALLIFALSCPRPGRQERADAPQRLPVDPVPLVPGPVVAQPSGQQDIPAGRVQPVRDCEHSWLCHHSGSLSLCGPWYSDQRWDGGLFDCVYHVVVIVIVVVNVVVVIVVILVVAAVVGIVFVALVLLSLLLHCRW